MIKRNLLLPLLSLFSIALMAVPAKRGLWRNLQLTDGTTVRAMLVGDEISHCWQDADGNRYCSADDSLFYRIDQAQISATAKTRRAKASAIRRQTVRRVADGASIFKGQRRGLIILAQFSNKQFSMSDPKAYYTRFANEENLSTGNFKGSVRDYFKAQSNGQFDLSFDIAGPVTLPNTYAYYGRNDSNGDDANAQQMIKDALDAIADTTDFSPYDWDGDGVVEEVFVLYAGYGEADSNYSSTVWPHMWSFGSSDIGVLTYHGMKIDVYACANEIDGSTSQPGGIGTVCHEFSHCMGFPDVYDTSSTGSNYGMGSWDLMDYGSYNGEGFSPSNYTAYERMVCGWTNPIELKADTVVTGMESLTNNGETFIVYNPNYKNEFFMLENRQQSGFDKSLAGSGMLITYIDYNESIWNYNVPNTYEYGNDHCRITLFPADNRVGQYNEFGDAYPYNGNDSLTATSKPAATLYHSLADGSKTMPYAITNISQHSDGTMSFAFALRTNSNTIPVVPANGVLLKETFDQCNGEGGNDGAYSGSVARGQFYPDVDGWEAVSAAGADKCAKFNSSKNHGIVQSPTFTLTGDTATITFRAVPWGTDGTDLDFKVNASGVTVVDTLLTMTTGAWTSYTIKAVGTGQAYLVFDPAKRFFLDDVTVSVPVTPTAIKTLHRNDTTPTDHYYSLSGIDMGADKHLLPKGIYIVNGRKIVVR